jgi:predicted regulator of Ras-like GTPase activity (Roadblock/LC7/MglB family)
MTERHPRGVGAALERVEQLRRSGNLDRALHAATGVLVDHPYEALAHDVLARVYAARGEVERAADEWEMAARLDPTLTSPQRGLAFLAFRAGRLAEAEKHLDRAGDGEESAPRRLLRAARETREVIPPVDTLFHPEMNEGAAGAILVEGDGVVVAGSYKDTRGRDVAEAVGAHLAGVSIEAERTLRDLKLGAWRSMTVESSGSALALAPVGGGRLVLIAAPNAMPVGRVKLLLSRAVGRARGWLGGTH